MPSTRMHLSLPPSPIHTQNTCTRARTHALSWRTLHNARVATPPPPRCRPLSTTEQSKYAAAMDDGGSTGRKRVAMPGAADPAKGPDMLAWRPEVRVPQFVPRGGMAQENRVKGSTLRGGLGV